MVNKLMIGDIELAYFTFCEITRNQNWRKIERRLIDEFIGFFGEGEFKNKMDWWNIKTIDSDFDATIICQNNVSQIEALQSRWQIRMYYPLTHEFRYSFMTPFIKEYCNPEGLFILEKVSMEIII